ncbi:S1 RNA-binding domain-containing protein [Pseudomonadota bacterium]
MAEIGQTNTLRVVKEVPFGVYLDGDEDGEILLPKRYVPEDCSVGDSLDVFLYFDSEDKLIATTQRPRAVVGKFAYLQVKELSNVGAFLDWGLPKDLLVPFPAQKRRMEEGKSYIVYVSLDNEGRIVATSKIDKFLDKWPARYEEGQEVNLMIAERTEMGYKAIINHRHWGLIHDTDVFKSLRYGKKIKGYIKTIREDGKIDLYLSKAGYGKVDDLAERILEALAERGGFIALHDKSPAEEIKHTFGESKKSFKSAIGALYKQKKIKIEKDGIRLV